MARPVTMPERTRIRASRRAGTSLPEIARTTGRSLQTIKRHAADIRADLPRGRKRILTPETCEALLREVDDEGWSRPMVARRHGLAQVTLCDALTRLRRRAREAAEAEAHALRAVHGKGYRHRAAPLPAAPTGRSARAPSPKQGEAEHG